MPTATEIRCWIGRQADLVFMGRLLAGLYDQPNARLKLEIGPWITSSHAMAVQVDELKIGIDLSDHADLWDTDLLGWADIYAKRSLNPAHPGPRRGRVIPLGLHCAGRSSRGLCSLMVKSIAAAGPRLDRERLRNYYRYLASAHWRDYEYSPDQPVHLSVLFQTRVWDPVDTPGDEGINQERVDLLRALRRAFKDRFVGGLVGNAVALRHYPELVTRYPTRQPQYIRWSKDPAIGIYSRGLFGSIAFKMAEFLASSKCVVSDPVENVTTGSIPLLGYRSIDECIQQCSALLDNPQELQARRYESWRYYQDYVRPGAMMARLIETARARMSGG